MVVDGGEVNTPKIVVVGDQRVGKTALVQRFITNQPPSLYMPTGFDNYSAAFEVAGYSFYATIWDTSGSPNYDTVRPLAYQDTDVFILCFHLGDWYSLHSVINKWYSEVRKYAPPSTPIILCGCQNDQRFVENLYASLHLPSDTKRKTVYSEEAMEVCRQIGAITYVETCAFNALTTREVFEVAALAGAGKFNRAQHEQRALMHAKQMCSLSSSLTLSSSSPSSTGGVSDALSGSSASGVNSAKLKSSSSSTHLLTRHKSMFKLRKCKSKGEMQMQDCKKSCAIM